MLYIFLFVIVVILVGIYRSLTTISKQNEEIIGLLSKEVVEDEEV